LTETFEIFLALFFHEIVFVGEGPPDIAIGSEPAKHIPEIMVVLRRSHAIEAPMSFIVRMKKDEIGFDSKFSQISDAFFEMPKEFWIKPREIPIVRRRSFERIHERLVRIPIVVFRKNAKADLIERRRCERL